jgi:hypothetical protein
VTVIASVTGVLVLLLLAIGLLLRVGGFQVGWLPCTWHVSRQ